MTDAIDVTAVVADLRAEVERRRETGGYDERALQALHEEFGSDFNEAPEAVAYVASSRPLASNRPTIGPVLVFTKRVVRRLLAWYVAPIAEDQTRYNIASIRLIRALEQRVAAVEEALASGGHATARRADPPGAIAELNRRLDRMEQMIDHLSDAPRRPDRG